MRWQTSNCGPRCSGIRRSARRPPLRRDGSDSAARIIDHAPRTPGTLAPSVPSSGPRRRSRGRIDSIGRRRTRRAARHPDAMTQPDAKGPGRAVAPSWTGARRRARRREPRPPHAGRRRRPSPPRAAAARGRRLHAAQPRARARALARARATARARPSPSTTAPGPPPPHVLDALAREGVRATFFVLGRQVERHPELVRRIVAEGHQLANHGYDHGILIFRGAAPRGRPARAHRARRRRARRAPDAMTRALPRAPRLPRPGHGPRRAAGRLPDGRLDARRVRLGRARRRGHRPPRVAGARARDDPPAARRRRLGARAAPAADGRRPARTSAAPPGSATSSW